MSFRPDLPHSQNEAVKRVQDCITDVRAGLVAQKLRFNDFKTEFLTVGTYQQLRKVYINSVRVGDVDIIPVKSVRNSGAWFDENMSRDGHVGRVCSKTFRTLYKIRQIRKFLSIESTKILVHAFVTSYLDCSNALFVGIPQYQIQRYRWCLMLQQE